MPGMQTAGLGDGPVPSPAPNGVLVPSPAACRGGCGSWGPLGCPPPSPEVPRGCSSAMLLARYRGADPGAGCPVAPWDGSLVPKPGGKARMPVEPHDAGSAGLQLQQCKVSGVKWGCGSGVGGCRARAGAACAPGASVCVPTAPWDALQPSSPSQGDCLPPEPSASGSSSQPGKD